MRFKIRFSKHGTSKIVYTTGVQMWFQRVLEEKYAQPHLTVKMKD